MNTFEDIVGQTLIKDSLQNALRTGRVSHSYIIVGEQGSGKMLIARALAKTLQCAASGVTPCCACVSCKTFDSGNHPDIIYPRPTKTKALGVTDSREQIIKLMETMPYNSKYKIFIIDEADTMTVEMQNALLKTIEEPPEYGVFIFSADNTTRFLPTVLSRSVVLKTLPLTKSELSGLLIDKLDISQSEALLYSGIAGGIPGKAFNMLQSEGFAQMREQIISILTEIHSRSLVDCFAAAKEFEPYKEQISDMLSIGMLWCRDALAVKSNVEEAFVIQSNMLDRLSDFASRYSCAAIYNIIDILDNTITIIGQNANFNLSIEVMLLKLKEISR